MEKTKKKKENRRVKMLSFRVSENEYKTLKKIKGLSKHIRLVLGLKNS